MKTIHGFWKMAALGVGLLLLSGSAMAQQGRGMGPCGQGQMKPVAAQHPLPQLTEDQQKQLQNARDEFRKEITPLRNDLNVLRAKLVSLQDDASPDTKAIQENIDQQTAVINKMMKARVAHQARVKTITGFAPGQGFGPHKRFQDRGPRGGHCPWMDQ